jgi:hypothetical protein
LRNLKNNAEKMNLGYLLANNNYGKQFSFSNFELNIPPIFLQLKFLDGWYAKGFEAAEDSQVKKARNALFQDLQGTGSFLKNCPQICN